MQQELESKLSKCRAQLKLMEEAEAESQQREDESVRALREKDRQIDRLYGKVQRLHAMVGKSILFNPSST